ncbi:MAG: hypothetical protein AB7N73_06895 [Gemmatimonadales bacterium]
MDARTRRKLSMASKVLDFSRANPADDPGYASLVERLATQIARAGELTDHARDTTVGERGALNRRRALRRRMRETMLHILRVAEIIIKERPDLADTFAAPRSRAPNRIFVSDARVLLARTREHADLFAALGFSAPMLEALGAAIEEFEGMGVQANDTRIGHVEAHAELARIVGDTGDIVAVLDSFNRARFVEDSGELVAWKSVRDIYGPVRRRVEPPEDASSTTPPTTDVDRDAA